MKGKTLIPFLVLLSMLCLGIQANKRPAECYKTPSVGSGNRYMKRYAYFHKFNKCIPTIWKGLYVSPNKFFTRIQCQLVCKPDHWKPKPLGPVTLWPGRDARCDMPLEEGVAGVPRTMYFFDIRTGTCQHIYIQPYGWVGNKYRTLAECNRLCRNR